MSIERERLTDVAASFDTRGVAIQRVGVREVHLPIQIRRKDEGYDRALARVDMSVDLPEEYRGTHMSRFLEILFKWSRQPIAQWDVERILHDVRDALRARRAGLDLHFTYFITKHAPVSGEPSALDYECCFQGDLDGDQYTFTLGVDAPVHCLCPCSKEISAYGAHNQRGVIRARVRCVPGQFIWIEDLVAMLEAQASAPLYPLLKREDEKWVTEHAYDNPKFVEDVVRDCVLHLRADPRVRWFRVECETQESIHNHQAYAAQEEGKEAQAGASVNGG